MSGAVHIAVSNKKRSVYSRLAWHCSTSVFELRSACTLYHLKVSLCCTQARRKLTRSLMRPSSLSGAGSKLRKSELWQLRPKVSPPRSKSLRQSSSMTPSAAGLAKAGGARLQRRERARRCPTSNTERAAASQSRSGLQLQPLQMGPLAPVLCEALHPLNRLPVLNITELACGSEQSDTVHEDF